MRQTSVASLEFLVSHLRWCLAQPLDGDPRAWAVRVSRAVDQVDETFTGHIELLDAPGGPLSQIADPCLFPFTAEAQHVRRLRRQHTAFRTQLHCAAGLLRDCLLLFTPPPEVSPTSGAPADLAEARALRMFGIVGSVLGDLARELEIHLDTEKALLADATAAGGQEPVRALGKAR
jgi:hypothetical protein